MQTATERRRRLPQPDLDDAAASCASPATRRSAPPSPWRARGASAPSPTSSRRGAGLQPIDVEIGDARRARLDAPGARDVRRPSSTRPRSSAPLGLDVSAAHPELPPQVVSTGINQMMVPVRDAAALDRVAPDPAALTVAARRAPRRRARTSSYIDADREAAQTRRFFVDPARRSRGPGDGLGRRAAHGLPARAHRASRASRSTRASRWAVPSRIECAVEGDRVRVGGRRGRRRSRHRRALTAMRPDRLDAPEVRPGACRQQRV